MKKATRGPQAGARDIDRSSARRQVKHPLNSKWRGRLCRCVTHELLATLVDGEGSSMWRAFLQRRGHLAAVVDHVIAVSGGEGPGVSPPASHDAVRDLVVEAAAHGGPRVFPMLRSYLGHRAYLPKTVRHRLDQAIMAGKKAAPARVIAFTSELRRTRERRKLEGISREVVDHWYGEVLAGHHTSAEVRKIPTQIAEACERLLAHLRRQQPAQAIDEAAVYERYAPVFTAPHVPAAVDILIGTELDSLRIDVEFIGPFLQRLSKSEVVKRFKMLKEWMAKTHSYDMVSTPVLKAWIGKSFSHDIVITPVLADFLSGPGDFSSMLGVLHRLMDETRSGKFRMENHLQRDLEFRKFVHEYSRLYGTNRRLPYVNELPGELYRRFTELPELSYEDEDHWRLDGRHLVEVRRVAYEVAGFLQFLRRFRAGTSRPIVVVGNNRYGRQWVLEPLEELLGDGFSLRYDGVPSHMSTRLSVPSARNFEQSADNTGPWTSDVFPMEFVRQMAREMPHFVVVDAMSAGKYRGLTMFSRATKNYAHWFAAFNDVRSEGERAAYEDAVYLPPDHLEELRHWYEFVRLRRQLSEWVTPGPTYRIGHWAPCLTEQVQLGEIIVPGRSPEFDSDAPQVVLANPVIYKTEGDDLPEALRGTSPYYFDGPEKYVQEELVFGFGPYGFQPEVRGTMTATFVAAVQRRITAEVAKLLPE